MTDPAYLLTSAAYPPERHWMVPTMIEVEHRVRLHGTRVHRDGAGPGSLTDDGLDYTVLDGWQVSEHLPVLYAWVATSGVRLANNVGRALGWPQLRLLADVGASVNVNLLEPGGEYEPHVDGVPYTAILFLSDAGAIHVWDDADIGGTPHIIRPERLDVFVFKGSEHAHSATNRYHGERRARITVPFSLHPLTEADYESTPRGDLDAHLYKPAPATEVTGAPQVARR